MRKFLLTLTAAILTAQTFYCSAEETAGGSRPDSGTPAEESIRFTPSQTAVVKYLSLLLDMVQARQASSVVSQDELDDQLTVIYERLTELYCMPYLHRELVYEGNPKHPRCLEYLTRLEELHPGNPVLMCAKHGIDSDLCAAAYEEQYIDTFSADKYDQIKSESDGVDLRTKLRTEMESENIHDLSFAVDQAVASYEDMEGRAVSPEERLKRTEELRQRLTKLLGAACPLNQIRLVHEPVDDRKKFSSSYKPQGKGDHPLSSLLGKLQEKADRSREKKRRMPPAEPSPSAAEEPDPFERRTHKSESKRERQKPFWRVRYVDRECMNAIRKGLTFDAHFPPAVCNLEGDSSPHCIQALRKQRSAKSNKAAPRERKTAPGLATF